MMIKDILAVMPLFNSTIFEELVTSIRDFLDPKANNLYLINSVDSYINAEYGTWEILPELESDEEIDTQEVRKRVDTVIACNAYYWEKLLESVLAEFNPLWNVDGTETTTHVHGKQKDTMTKGPTELTDVYGEKQDVANLAKTTRSEKLDAAKVTEYEYDEDKTTLEHGDHGVYENVADSQHGVPQSGQTVTHVDGQKTVTHRETTMDNTATFRDKWQEETKQTPNTYDSDTYGPKATKETTGNDVTTRDEKTDKVTEKPYERKDIFEQTKDGQGNGDVYKTSRHTDTHSTVQAVDTKESDTFTDTITVLRQGNIGVTMTTELLSEFQKYARKSKLVPIIAQEISKSLAFAIWY